MKPICFKVRGGGNYSGVKGGQVRSGKGGTGMLFYEDKTFTVATGTDQYIATFATNNNMSHEQYPINLPEPQPKGKPLRYLSVCSGMEAASVAWHPLGWTPVGFSEIEPFPCAILKHRFPNVPNYGDLTKHAEWPLSVGDVDLICGGTPCQAFSVAGLRQGLADPRGNLALVFLGLVDRLRPKYVLWENVPGVLSSNRGEDFAAFVGALAELGYGFAWRCVDAQFFGVPQRRKRVYLFAIQGTGNWRTAAEILFEPEGLRGDFEASRKAREEAAPDAGSGVEAGGKKWPAKLACTLNASFGEKQGLEDQHALGGGSLFVPAATIGTLCARDYKGVGNQYVQEGKCIPCPAPTPFRKSKRACSATDNETWVLADEANTLNNFDLGDTRTTHAVVDSTTAISFSPGNLVRKAGPNPSSETFPTLSKDSGDQNPHVAYVSQGVDLYNQTLTGDLHVPLRTAGGHGAPATIQAMAVRRLTPEECEKLQGFKSGWSKIPWKGKSEEQCPDGPRYKACGNSMAVPCMFWIGNRIAQHEAKA